LVYYCIGNGQNDIKSLVERYAFFEDLQNDAIGFPDNKTLYSPQAFGKKKL